MAALARRELEAAKLKDENVTLSQEVTKLATHVNTSLKLNARIFREQTSSEKAIQRLTKEVQDLETEKRLLERRVKEEIALRKLSEEKLRTIQSDFNTRLRKLESIIKEKEICFSDELVAIRNDHEVEIENLKKIKGHEVLRSKGEYVPNGKSRSIKITVGEEYRNMPDGSSPLKHKVLDLENEVAACNNLLRQHQAKHAECGNHLKASLKSLDEYRKKLQENEMEKKNMLRELNIKDKQLKKLRTDLEFGNASNDDGAFNSMAKQEDIDDAIEFMKEEMLAMKSTYEKQIHELKDEIEAMHQQIKRRRA
eukprot:g4483.t1